MDISKDVTFTKAAFIAHDFSAFIVKGWKNRNAAANRRTYYSKVLNQTIRSSRVSCIQTCQPFLAILHVSSACMPKELSFCPPPPAPPTGFTCMPDSVYNSKLWKNYTKNVPATWTQFKPFWRDLVTKDHYLADPLPKYYTLMEMPQFHVFLPFFSIPSFLTWAVRGITFM